MRIVIHFIHQIHQPARAAPHHLLSPEATGTVSAPACEYFLIIGVVWAKYGSDLRQIAGVYDTAGGEIERVFQLMPATRSERNALCQPSLLEPNDYRV
jgi:hypothetical protein